MPSARIMTRAVEDAYSLAQDLRTRGFVVQIVSPDYVSTNPVDLEVTLEECEPEAALHRADDAPAGEDLCVFVAPGALTEGHRPIRVVPLFVEAPSVVTMPVRPAAVPITEKETFEELSALEAPGIEEAEEKNLAEAPPIIAELPMVNVQAQEPPVTKLPLTDAPVLEDKTVLSDAPTFLAEARGEKVKPAPPLSIGRKISYRKATLRLSSWMTRAGSTDKLLLKAATIAATTAVVAISVLVLGSTAHRFSPINPSVQSAGESLMLPASTKASTVPGTPPQEAKAVLAAPPAPAPKPPARTPKSSSRRGYNPEEDVVAKDFVIRYGNRHTPPRTQAKKTAGVKHYSDMN
jgi:hypothetical protein